MRKRVIGVVLAMAMAVPPSTIVAAPKSPKLAKCDGKQRRPANPYGSILPTVDPQTGETKPANQPQSQSSGKSDVEVFPSKGTEPRDRSAPEGKAEPVVPPISSALSQRNHESC